MRWLLTIAFAIALAANGVTAVAKNVSVPFHVTLRVADSCTLSAPSTLPGTDTVTLATFAPSCGYLESAAAVTLERQIHEGAYVATINF